MATTASLLNLLYGTRAAQLDEMERIYGTQQTVLAPTSQGYQQATQAAQNNINAGMGNVNNSLDTGRNDVQSALAAAMGSYGQGQDYLNTATQNVNDIYGTGIQNIQDVYSGATNAYDSITNMMPEAVDAYKNRVLSDFDTSYNQYTQSPVYQFGLQEGLRGIQNMAVAQGMGQSGATMKAMQRFMSDYNAQQYNDYQQNRVAQAKGLAEFAQSGAQGAANVASSLAGNLSGLYQGQGTQVGQLGQAQGNLAAQQAAAQQSTGSTLAALEQQRAQAQAQAAAANADYGYQGTLGSSITPQTYQTGGITGGNPSNYNNGLNSNSATSRANALAASTAAYRRSQGWTS